MVLKRSFGIVIAIIMIFTLIGPVFQGDTYAASTVGLNKKKATVYVGKSVTLKMDGTKGNVKWSSSNKKVATVNSKGKVIGKKAGSITIKAKISGKTYKCSITVKNPYINYKKLSLKYGKTKTLKLYGTKIKSVSSSNKEVATISKSGKVTAKKLGTATIKIKGTNGKTYKCKVSVTGHLNKNAVSLEPGQTLQLRLYGTSIKSIKTSDKNVATVNKKGLVTAKNIGECKITVTGKNKKKYICNVTVFKRETYTITYNLNKGENAAVNPSTYIEGEEVLLADPTRENHTFKGWFLDGAYTKKIDKIDANTKGNLTLYAKWHLESLNIAGEGMEDMIWSWWYYPQVISQGSNVFWGYATKDGYCGVAKYDTATGKIVNTSLKKASADDHNGLALTLLEDKRIMCVYAGGHNTDNEIHIRISDAPMDIASFGKDIVLESSGKTCYSQIVYAQGKYYLFYRVNNNSWAYRYSADGLEWSDETILVKASMQYYCKVVKTTENNMLRIVMYSNPAATAPEIRMGFMDVEDNNIYGADGKTRLEIQGNAYDSFDVIQNVDKGKTQRLFDVAVTDIDKPKFLFATFTSKSLINDSVYRLYDAGKVYDICAGGKPLWDPKYQLGAAFVDENTIVAGRNYLGTDYIELYKYNGKDISLVKTLDFQSGTALKRNARPIVDVNGKAILWHNGYYNLYSYSDFDTDARLYLIEDEKMITKPQEGLDAVALGKVNIKNIEKAEEYIDKLYNENKDVDPLVGDFTWQKQLEEPSWIYYTGVVHDGFMQLNPKKYSAEVKEFYSSHIKDAGSIKYYHHGTLDSALPAINMISLLRSGELAETEHIQYEKAVNYVYNQLEKQVTYPSAGNMMQHAQNSDGASSAGWTKWNICLDGVYMSQTFLMRLAEAIDDGSVVVKNADGDIVTSSEIWNDVYERMNFVMKKMISNKTGLAFHGYCVETNETNKAYWTRSIGWYTMALVEAAEKMPDIEKREFLKEHFNELMEAIIQYQDPETFLWYNVPNEDGKTLIVKDGKVIENKPESSGSAMLTYSLLRGYHKGLLQEEVFRVAGLRAYNSLVETKLTSEGLTDIILASAVHTNTTMYQISGYVINDGKGVGPFIMATKYAY